MFATPPVVFNGVDIFDDGWIQASVEGVWGVGFTRLGFEKVLDPAKKELSVNGDIKAGILTLVCLQVPSIDYQY